MSEHNGHRKRVKEKILQYGFENMNTQELLELLLFYSIPRGDTNPIAYNLSENFGSISNVFDAQIEEVLKLDGIGQSTATLVKAVGELVPVYEKIFQERQELIIKEQVNITIQNREDAGKFFISKFKGIEKGLLMMAFIDRDMQLISTEDVTKYDPESGFDVIDLDKVMEYGVKYPATRAVLARNKPVGVANQVEPNMYTINKLLPITNSINIKITEHLVITGEKYVSRLKY